MERRIKSYIRWNAMAMVVNANRKHSGLGGHISTYASCATLYEVAFNHFFRGAHGRCSSATWFISRATRRRAFTRARFWKAGWTSSTCRISARNLPKGGGLSSYPHPYLMPDFWQFPTVSMGLGADPVDLPGAVQSLPARARTSSMATSRRSGRSSATANATSRKRSARSRCAARENLDNLIWVVNCNLQRLDGPVRGNGKIIQELEALFRGAGWNVIKVIWGSDWDDLLARDKTGLLLKRMEEAVDGDYQKYSVEPGSYTRKHFFGKYPELLQLVNHLTRRADPQAAARRPRHAQRFMPPTKRRSNTRASRR